MKKIIITIIVLLLIGGGAYYILEKNKEKNAKDVAIVAETNNAVAVRADVVKPNMVSEDFSANGTFQALQQAYVSAEMGGQLVAIYVKEGSYVRPGQTIAKLKGDKIDVNVQNAKAALDNATSQLERFEAAYQTGGVTAQQLDQMKLQVKNARAQYQSAQLTSGDTNVRTKIGGIVNRKMVEVGAVVGAGNPIVEVVNISELKLRVTVDEGDVTGLNVGDVVEVKPTVLNEPVQGKITFISPASDGALKFPVEITVSNKNQKLKAGMYATAYFKLNNENKANEVLTIPRDAFVGSVSQNKVFQVIDSMAQLKEIKSGRNFGDKVEVISGLKEGDVVITSGQINLDNGTRVRIIK